MGVLEPFRADPRGSALLLDIDGTLAPIVPHPAGSRVADDLLEILRRLADRYALVGCVSGRAAADAAALVPVPGVAIAGNHGLETLEGGVVHAVPEVEEHLPAIAALVWRLAPLALRAGAWIEDKSVTLAVHYRQADDPAAARTALERDAVPLIEAAGLVPRFGRMVLEVLPPVPIDKGAAVRRLLRGHPIARSLYAGDDVTDLAAFAAVDVAVAVRSDETPPGLVEAATLAVDGVEGVRALLADLAAA